MDALAHPLHIPMQEEIEFLGQAVRRALKAGQIPGLDPQLPPDDSGARILERLSTWLLDEEQKQAVEQHPVQIYCLHAAAILGDILRVGMPAAAQDGAISQDLTEWIRRNWRVLGIQDKERAGILVRIFQQMSKLSDQDAPEDLIGSTTFQAVILNTGLIAAAVRLSQALELKSASTFMEILENLPQGEGESSKDLMDAFQVDHVGPHPYMPATIQVKIRCRHPELHRALKHHERSVLRMLNTFNQRIRPRFLFSDLIYEIDPEGYRPVDLKFSVDTSAALQLFMGNRLYADKRVFLRELIQNAVDACNVRKLADPGYSPAISIGFNDDISVITVRDNGIGMDRQWLEKYFLSIGISFYQSDEIKTVTRDPRIDIGFISQFGIGFLSSFLVAEKIIVKTRKTASSGLMITITSLKDYFDVRTLDEDLPAGTDVTLHLKPSKINYCRSLEFMGYLKTNIRFLQIPVRFTNEEGTDTIIGREPLSYAADRRAPTDFVASMAFADAEGYLYLSTKMNGGRIFALETAAGGISLFQDGIFVTQDDSLLPEGARQHVVGRVNLKGRDKCELSMDRNRIFWTKEQKTRIRREIRLALADLANRLMKTVDTQDANPNTLQSILNQLAIFFDFSEVDDGVYGRLCPPLRNVVNKRFRDFIRVHFRHTGPNTRLSAADGYNEIWQQEILKTFTRKS